MHPGLDLYNQFDIDTCITGFWKTMINNNKSTLLKDIQGQGWSKYSVCDFSTGETKVKVWL